MIRGFGNWGQEEDEDCIDEDKKKIFFFSSFHRFTMLVYNGCKVERNMGLTLLRRVVLQHADTI